MTDSRSEQTSWNGYVEEDAPTRISGPVPQRGEVSAPQYPSQPQGYHSGQYPSAPSGYGSSGPSYAGSSSQDGQYGSQPHGAHQYTPQGYGGYQYPSSGYGSPQYSQGGYGAPHQGYGAPMQPGMYPMAPGIPGVTVDPMTGEPLSDKSKVAAGFLQFFLGYFGAGRFYIGDTTTGAIQLGLFFLGFITLFIVVGAFVLLGLSLWALVDAILMWTGSVRDGQGRKLR